jgi:hypothetical protein
MSAGNFWMMPEVFLKQEMNSMHYDEHPLLKIPIIFLTAPVNTIMIMPVIFSIVRRVLAMAGIENSYQCPCGALLKGIDSRSGY